MKEKSKRQLFPKEYSTWKTIKSRCNAPSQSKRGNYKKNNIQVCDEWINSFDKFLEDMGPRPEGKYTIERIDNLKNYCKENCKWATWSEQRRNIPTMNINYTYNGETKILKDWATFFNIKYTTLYNRINKGGLSFEEAIKDDPYNKLYEINGNSKRLKEWCEEYGIDLQAATSRIYKGWDIVKTLTTPVKSKK